VRISRRESALVLVELYIYIFIYVYIHYIKESICISIYDFSILYLQIEEVHDGAHLPARESHQIILVELYIYIHDIIYILSIYIFMYTDTRMQCMVPVG